MEYDFKMPMPIITILRKDRSTIQVYEDNGKLHISYDGYETLYEDATKFRCILFEGCTKCDIYINAKVLKIDIVKCKECYIEAQNIIGEISLIYSHNIDIHSTTKFIYISYCSYITLLSAKKIETIMSIYISCYVFVKSETLRLQIPTNEFNTKIDLVIIQRDRYHIYHNSNILNGISHHIVDNISFKDGK